MDSFVGSLIKRWLNRSTAQKDVCKLNKLFLFGHNSWDSFYDFAKRRPTDRLCRKCMLFSFGCHDWGTQRDHHFFFIFFWFDEKDIINIIIVRWMIIHFQAKSHQIWLDLNVKTFVLHLVNLEIHFVSAHLTSQQRENGQSLSMNEVGLLELERLKECLLDWSL